MSPHAEQQLLHSRNKSVAKSLYRQLRTQGFTHEQIIELSSSLLELVTLEVRDRSGPCDCPQAR
ncbi:MAG: hypothetical protein GXP62_13950 [Oligoflexia bacterium]|nr:hypothetical protein [Oligoflexia bacterium]